MTEVAVDSAVSSEQPSGAQPSESVSEMGMGFIEADASPLDSDGSGAEQPAAGEGAVAAVPTTNTEAPTPPTTETTTDEAGTLRQADYTRKTQEVAEERRQVAAERAQMAEERRIFAEAQARANQPPATDPVQALAAQLGPEEARGLTVVDQLIQERSQAIAAAEISKALEPYKAYLDRLEPAMGMVNQVAQQQNAAAQQQANAQIEAAEAIFGKVDSWDSRHRSLVGALTNQENPDTGQRFTVAEAMSLATGRRLTDQQDAVGAQRTARNAAKRSTAGQSGSPSLVESNGTISREQALAEIRSTM
tara:strand:- start:548 stop:1465 length:918 start_codon:yes stop_codon:yes gene_type:complete